VQRILKYHLLLRELSKNTENSSGEKDVIEKALSGMQSVAQNINEIKRLKENQQNLLDLQKRIEGYEGVSLQSLGNLILDGNMTMFEKIVNVSGNKKTAIPKGDNEYHFFLFKESILCCKEFKRKQKDLGYKFKQMIPMGLILVKDKVNNYGEAADMICAWELVRMDLQKTYIMISKSLEEKQRWINETRLIIKSLNGAPSSQSLNELDKSKFYKG
jgi:hypothetical protein